MNTIGSLIGENVRNVLIVSGNASFRSSERRHEFLDLLKRRSIGYYDTTVKGEPSPETVDTAVAECKGCDIDLVISIGGGSVIDAGKAVSAMLTQTTSVVDFLEGVGTGAKHNGDKIPFIAVPTTAGTGSETTKNAVLSRVGENGFKKSLRHDNFVPDIAIVDPELMLSCPPALTAACGMDAFSQLLESYVSTQSNPLTDALAFSGLVRVKESLVEAFKNGTTSLASRSGMAYAAFLSGITLANAGLGIVHGLASPIGGYCTIPHGVVCGTLLEPSMRITLRKLRENGNEGDRYLEKFAQVGKLFSGNETEDKHTSCDMLVENIGKISELMELPLLIEYGLQASDLETIVDKTNNRNNPAILNRDEILEILSSRM